MLHLVFVSAQFHLVIHFQAIQPIQFNITDTLLCALIATE